VRMFELHRETDLTGVSGVGIVAEGVQFGNGRAALCWLTEHTSVAVYDDMGSLEAIHGHHGATKVVWLDEY
jgi:hypothetical protein